MVALFMHSTDVKNRAVELRKEGKTYSDINKYLGLNISKSTLSGWFKNIALSKINSKKLKSNIAYKIMVGQLVGRRILFKKRKKYLRGIVDNNLKYTKDLNFNLQKIMLSILYLGEGAKYKSTDH